MDKRLVQEKILQKYISHIFQKDGTMKTKISWLAPMIFFCALLLNSSTAVKGHSIHPNGQKGRNPLKPDIPQILEFNVTPNKMYPGQTGSAVFDWRVIPVPGGSAIRSITLTRAEGRGPIVNYSRTDATGRYEMSIPDSLSPGQTSYVLTAENTARKRKSATVTFEVGTIEELRKLITITSITANPNEVQAGTGPFTLDVSIQNRSGVEITGANITVDFQPPMRGSRRVGESRFSRIRTINLAYPVSGVEEFRGVPGEYHVKVYLGGAQLDAATAVMEVIRTIKVYKIMRRR